MSMYEPCIAEICFYCENDFINTHIAKNNLTNIKIHKLNEIKVRECSKKIDFDFNIEYFDKEKVNFIIGEKLEYMPKECQEICFLNSREDSFKISDFKGIIICMDSNFVDKFKKNIIVVNTYKEALYLIYCIYFSLNSVHIIPYDTNMLIENDIRKTVKNTYIQKLDKNFVTIFNFIKHNLGEEYKAIFINTSDENILERKNGIDIYDKMVNKYKEYINYNNTELSIVINYTKEIGDEIFEL